jgi:hypothetical protein
VHSKVIFQEKRDEKDDRNTSQHYLKKKKKKKKEKEKKGHAHGTTTFAQASLSGVSRKRITRSKCRSYIRQVM